MASNGTAEHHGPQCRCAMCGAGLPGLPLDLAFVMPDCIFALSAGRSRQEHERIARAIIRRIGG